MAGSILLGRKRLGKSSEDWHRARCRSGVVLQRATYGMMARDDKPWFCFGVMGGDMQPQGHVQVLVNLIDFEMNVQAAGDAARVRHTGSATPRGDDADGSGAVFAESGISEAVVSELRVRGHRVERRKASFGGYQGILIDWERGVLHGGTESRKDGAAVGW